MSNLDSLRFIVQLYASNATAAEILNHFASRQRNRRAEPVRRLQQVCGNGTTRQSVITVLRQLETHGFGSFVSGRRGHESRFVWKEA